MTEKEEHYEKAHRLYEAVMREVSRILHDCKLLPIAVLRLADEPTYEELGQILGVIAVMLKGIAEISETEEIANKAIEYVKHAQEIAQAIVNDDEERLDELVAELDKRSFIL